MHNSREAPKFEKKILPHNVKFGKLHNGHRDEYAYRIPNPKHMPKYTKVKVLLLKINTHS